VSGSAPFLEALAGRREALLRRVEALRDGSGRGDASAAGDPGEEIVALVREVDEALERLRAFREGLREVAAAYKEVRRRRPGGGVARGMAPAPPRADHLGSSTYIERGWTAIAAGEYEKAVVELQRALELAPGDAQAEGLLGWAQMLLERYDEALFSFQKVLVHAPDDALARVNLGYICLKKGIFGEAIEHLAGVIREEGDRKALLYANLYLGLTYLEREMYADARSFFERALELGPNLIEAYWELGRAYYLEGDHQAATAAWRRGAEANRLSSWGERCAAAAEAVAAGEKVGFG
jgi:tetratricopeptide (TPR) repeat protein